MKQERRGFLRAAHCLGSFRRLPLSNFLNCRRLDGADGQLSGCGRRIELFGDCAAEMGNQRRFIQFAAFRCADCGGVTAALNGGNAHSGKHGFYLLV